MKEEEKGRVVVITPITRYPGFDTIEEGEQFIKKEGLKNSVARELIKPVKPEKEKKPTDAELNSWLDGEIKRLEGVLGSCFKPFLG